MKISKSMQVVSDYIEQHGWRIQRHTRDNTAVYFVKPGAQPILVCLKSTEPRAAKNALAQLRRQDQLIAEKETQHSP